MELNRRHLLAYLAATGLVSPAIAAPAGFDLELTNEGLILPVIVRGKRLRGVLDCGASASVIDSGVARDLGLVGERERRGAAVYKSIRATQSQSVLIAAGDTAYTAPLVIMPLKQAGLRSDIIIGRDILNGHTLDLNGPALRASFLSQRVPLPDMIELPVTRSQKNSIVIDMQIEGVPVRASADTGSSTPLILKTDWARKNGVLDGRAQWQQLGGDVTGVHSVTMSSIDTATVGGMTFRDVPVEISDNHLEYDVNLGLDFFLRLHSFWDLADNRIWLSGRTADLERPFNGR